MQESEQKTPETPKTDTANKNFDLLRRRTEKLEESNQSLMKALEDERKGRHELENRLKPLSGVKDEDSEEEYTYVSKKEMRSTFQSEKEELKKQIREEIEKESYQRKSDLFFQSRPDFNSVVTEENVNKLKQYDPAFVSVIDLVPDKLAQFNAVYGKVKEMQEREAAAPKKGVHPHPYIAASPFGSSGVTNAPVMSSQSRMTDPNARMEARKLADMYKAGLNGA